MMWPQAAEARLESSMALRRFGLPSGPAADVCRAARRICSATSATTSGDASPSSGGRGTRISRKGTSWRTASISSRHSLPRQSGVVPRHIEGAGQHVVLHGGQGDAVVAADVAGEGHAGGRGLHRLAEVGAGEGGRADLGDHRGEAVRGQELCGEQVRDPGHDGAGLEEVERGAQGVQVHVAPGGAVCMAC